MTETRELIFMTARQIVKSSLHFRTYNAQPRIQLKKSLSIATNSSTESFRQLPCGALFHIIAG